jgi:uncharacterized integral membrane protein
MKFLGWLFRAAIFVAALGFALSNTRVTELRFFGFDDVWSAPLVVFLLVFFVAGIIVGLMAVAPTLYRQRREIARLGRRPVEAVGASTAAPMADVPRESGAAESSSRGER